MTAYLRIKICGVTRVEDARRAAELGADALGLNFYPGSPRFLRPARAAAILDELPAFVEPVGVFVERTLANLERELRHLPRLRSIQWHGDSPPPRAPAGHRYIPAFQVRDAGTLAQIDAFLAACRAHGRLPVAVLVDAYVAGLHGGTGRAVPWELLAGWRPAVPLILAGGLTPENVAEAVRRVRPFAVDVAGGVESAPGVKCHDKMLRFIAAARAAAGEP